MGQANNNSKGLDFNQRYAFPKTTLEGMHGRRLV